MNALKEKITDRFESLSPQLQKAAHFVLEHSDDIALKPMREVAEMADVTTNVLVRLAKELDYEGYAAFRDVFQDHLREKPASLVRRGTDLQQRQDAAGELSEQIAEQAHYNISRTIAQCRAEDVSCAVQKIQEADHLYVMGLRSCYPAAYAFYYAFNMFNEKACLIEGHAGTLGDQLRPLNPRDVLLVFSTSPFSRDGVKAAQYAKEKGANVIAIVDQAITPFRDLADLHFECASHSSTLFASPSGLMTLGEILLARLLSQAGKPAIDAMEQSQKQLIEFNAYWSE